MLDECDVDVGEEEQECANRDNKLTLQGSVTAPAPYSDEHGGAVDEASNPPYHSTRGRFDPGEL